MRFVDANVFIYAVLKPRRALHKKEEGIKAASKEIFKRIDEGEGVLTSVVHLSEVANVMEDAADHGFSLSLVKDILLKRNIRVEAVADSDYLAASLVALEKKVSVNDALAYNLMKQKGIFEIYTFDRHFEGLDVKVIQG